MPGDEASLAFYFSNLIYSGIFMDIFFVCCESALSASPESKLEFVRELAECAREDLASVVFSL